LERDFGGKSDRQKINEYITVPKPFDIWKKPIETFSRYYNTQFHKNNVLFGENFVNTYTKRQPNIKQQRNTARANF